jgi:hypothetical protein
VLENSRSLEILMTAGVSTWLVSNALTGVRSGTVTLLARRVKKEDDERLFWFAVWLSGALALAVLATLLTPKEQLDNVWLPLILSMILLLNALGGLVNGKASLLTRSVTNGEHRVQLWLAVAVPAVLGIGGLGLMFASLFSRF